MKKIIYVVFLLTALGLTAFNSVEKKTEENITRNVEATEYKLVASESQINWRGEWVAPGENGEMREVKNHVGHVKFSDGKVIMKDSDISGSFAIDMTTITNEDLQEVEKRSKLEGHLKSEDFFSVSKYATADVEIKSVKKGKANITINAMDVEMNWNVPVMVQTKDDKLIMTGDFVIDFSTLNMPMTQPNAEKPEEGHINPKVDFSLNILMKK